MIIQACIRSLFVSSLRSDLGAINSLSDPLFRYQGRCMAKLSPAITSEPSTKIDDKIQVVLLRRIPKLGPKGAVVHANAGWVRSQLFPMGAVVYATPEMVERHSMSMSEQQKLQDPKELENRRLNKLIGALTTARIHIPRRIDWRTQKEGKEDMIGTVTAWDIVEATRRQYGICLDMSHLIMKEGISQFGHYKIPLNLRTREDRQVELSVIVQRVRSINHGHQYV